MLNLQFPLFVVICPETAGYRPLRIVHESGTLAAAIFTTPVIAESASSGHTNSSIIEIRNVQSLRVHLGAIEGSGETAVAFDPYTDHGGIDAYPITDLRNSLGAG